MKTKLIMPFIKKIKNILFITIYILFHLYSNVSASQKSNIIKTVENVDGKKRRIITYDSLMSKVREEYYGTNEKYGKDQDQILIVSIDYKDNKITKITGFNKLQEIEYKIDFLIGNYFDKLKNVNLKFRDNFIFDGTQEGENIVVQYKEGVKHGKLIQADSALLFSKKSISSTNKSLVKSSKFNILKFHNDINKLDNYSYTIYNGILFNFQNGKAHGYQSSRYPSTHIHFNGLFDSGLLIKYDSFDEQENYISKINTNNGFSNGIQLLNGIPISDTNIYFFNYQINSTGNIVYTNDDKLIQQQDYSWSGFKPGYLSNLDQLYGRMAVTMMESDWKKYIDYDRREYFIEKSRLGFKRDSTYTLRFKNIIDDNKITFSDSRMMKYLLNIPDFEITKFKLIPDENKIIIPISANTEIENNLRKLKIKTLQLNNGFYFQNYDFIYNKFYNVGDYKKTEFHFLFDKNNIESDLKNEKTNIFNSKLLLDINQDLTLWFAKSFNINTPFREYKYKNLGYEKYSGYEYEFITNKNDLDTFIKQINIIINCLNLNQTELLNKEFEIPIIPDEEINPMDTRYIGNSYSPSSIQNIDKTSFIKFLDRNNIEIKYKNTKYRVVINGNKIKWELFGQE